MTFFCIEILGESSFHKFLVQSGWSGKDYVFHYNRHTHSHMRAYRRLEEYHAERVDLHKSANVWPLLGNLLTAEKIEPHVFVGVQEERLPLPSTPEPEPFSDWTASSRKRVRSKKKDGTESSPAEASAERETRKPSPCL